MADLIIVKEYDSAMRVFGMFGCGNLFMFKDLGFIQLNGAIAFSEARNTEHAKKEVSKVEDGKESGARAGMGPSATRPAQAHPGTSRARAPKPLTGQCRHNPSSHLTPSSPWTLRGYCRRHR